jgi:hypothetical protein
MSLGKCTTVKTAALRSWVCFPKEGASGIGIIGAWHGTPNDPQFLVVVEKDRAVMSEYKGIVYCICRPLVEPTLPTFQRTPNVLPGGLACSDDDHFLAFELANQDKYFLNLSSGVEGRLGVNFAWFSQWSLYYEKAGDFEEIHNVSL